MASSDDEGETLPDSISEYYFCDGEDQPLSFFRLPVQWNENESTSLDARSIFLRGTADNGLQKLYKQVKAWKFDLSKRNHEISVLDKDNHWFKLQKPRKSYEKEIRTILITVQCLCFFKKEPEASGKSLWDHLSKVFRLYDVRPSENDLIDHTDFIREAIKRDETLAKSKFLADFLENPKKRKLPDEDAEKATKPSFIVDDDEPQDDDFITKQTEDSESDEEADDFDSVCAICDNGGELTCCEGKCFRSFHANKDIEEAEESNCESLGLPPELVKGSTPFRCENCMYNRHQCFVCGELGSSDKSSAAEVFRCSSATCGHFYHPRCVGPLLHRYNGGNEPQDLKEKIAAGEPFICPAHKCVVCKQTENENVKDLQFAVCRRCPASYHRKCLPSKIKFDHEIDDEDDDAVPRAWDDLLPKSRALIYCLKHEIDEDIGTPARTLKFKDIFNTKTPKKKKVTVGIELDNNTSKQTSLQKSKKPLAKLEDSSKKRARVSSGSESLKKRKTGDNNNNNSNSKKSLKKTSSTKVKTTNDNNQSLGSQLFDYMQKGPESNDLENDENFVDEEKSKSTTGVDSLEQEVLPPLDDDSKQRILALMKEASSSITLDDVKKYHKGKVPSTHAHSSRVDKSIILARVEGSVEALHVALKKLEEGCSIEDAMAVCEPGVIDQISRWKEKLKVYLAPFLHGMRYTSFGRHFTKVDKLEKIIDKLQWYIEDGDTVVDFACGANDFSCLVKKRLDEMGKKRCSYKNYDITRPKNDFNFEKRDWMTVTPKDLPRGSRLIMGLNPPFGKSAALANQFIEKALRFKPKLLILIAPPETERLDSQQQKVPYDLIWKDVKLLAGKSFYLPGSADVNDKIMDQWNNTPPPLYLWSRSDWTNKHISIAQKHGHIPPPELPKCLPENTLPIDPPKENNNNTETDLPIDNLPIENKVSDQQTTDKPKNDTKKIKKQSPKLDDTGTETKKKSITEKEKSNKKSNSNKRNDRSQESKRVKVEDKRSPDQDQAQKHDDRRSPSTYRQDSAQKHDDRVLRQDSVQKHDDRVSPATFRQDFVQKHDDRVSSATFRQDQALKVDERRRSPVVASRQDPAPKPDERRRSPVVAARQELAPKSDERRRSPVVASRQDPAPKHDERRRSPVVAARQDPAPKPDERRRSPATFRQDQVPKLEERRRSPVASRHDDRRRSPVASRHDDRRRSPVTYREDHSKNHDDRRSPARHRQAYDHHHLERRYNPTTATEPPPAFGFHNDVLEPRYTDDSTFSLTNDFEPHFDRRYGGEEPYLTNGSTAYGLDLSIPPGYSMSRPEHPPYPVYDPLTRGSYFNEINPRTGGGYYGSVGPTDPAPYNRTSTSTMQRYAPRLDELNHTRMGTGMGMGMGMGRVDPDEMNHVRMGMGMGPSNQGLGGYGGAPVHGPGFRTDSMGFAHQRYPQSDSSGGWLNE